MVASGHDTFLRDLHQLFPLDEPSVDSAAYFWCFVFLHLHLYAHAACAADLVIDVSRLAEDKEYRRRVEQQIGDTAGIAVDLSDALRSQAYSLVHLGTPEHMMEQLRPIADVIAGQARGQAGSDLVMTAVSDLSAAYARYIAEAGPLIEVVADSSGLLGQRADLLAKHDRLAGERDALQLEHDRLSVECAQLRDAGGRMTDDCARLRFEIDRLASDCARQQAESNLLTRERDQLQIKADHLTATYDAIQRSTSWRITKPVRLLGRLFR